MKTLRKILLFALAAILVSCTTDVDDEWNASVVCPESERGTFVDERDGQVYKYTTIGNQVWMAQNLNYKDSDSYCRFEEDDCVEKGRLYPYVSSVVDSGCPRGWHIPSIEEWNVMISEMGGAQKAGSRLKSKMDWRPLNPGDESNGSDECGFSALPVQRYKGTQYGTDANFMSSTTNCDPKSCRYDNYSHCYYFKRLDTDSFVISQEAMALQDNERMSVRCVKD